MNKRYKDLIKNGHRLYYDNWGGRFNELTGDFWVDFYYQGKRVNTIHEGTKTFAGTAGVRLRHIKQSHVRWVDKEGVHKWDKKKKVFVLTDEVTPTAGEKE